MFIYTNSNGKDVVCHGAQDMLKADGANFNLRPMIVTNEEGELIGVQNGELTLQKSMGIIENLKTQHKEELLRKSQKQASQLKKSFKQQKPLHRSSSQQASTSFANKAGFTKLLNELDTMRRDQNQFMKARV